MITHSGVVWLASVGAPSTRERPVERRAAHVKKIGHILAGFTFVDHFPGVVDLLGREARLPTKLHASALRGLHSGAGAFVDCFGERMEFHTTGAEVVQHRYQVT